MAIARFAEFFAPAKPASPLTAGSVETGTPVAALRRGDKGKACREAFGKPLPCASRTRPSAERRRATRAEADAGQIPIRRIPHGDDTAGTTPYEVLGVDRKASHDEIERAKLAKELDPDGGQRGGRGAFQGGRGRIRLRAKPGASTASRRLEDHGRGTQAALGSKSTRRPASAPSTCCSARLGRVKGAAATPLRTKGEISPGIWKSPKRATARASSSTQ